MSNNVKPDEHGPPSPRPSPPGEGESPPRFEASKKQQKSTFVVHLPLDENGRRPKYVNVVLSPHDYDLFNWARMHGGGPALTLHQFATAAMRAEARRLVAERMSAGLAVPWDVVRLCGG